MAIKSASVRTRRKCINCHKRKIRSRGNCQACLRLVHLYIDTGQYTEQELIDKGMLLRAKKPGRPASNEVLRRLEKAGARNGR